MSMLSSTCIGISHWLLGAVESSCVSSDQRISALICPTMLVSNHRVSPVHQRPHRQNVRWVASS